MDFLGALKKLLGNDRPQQATSATRRSNGTPSQPVPLNTSGRTEDDQMVQGPQGFTPINSDVGRLNGLPVSAGSSIKQLQGQLPGQWGNPQSQNLFENPYKTVRANSLQQLAGQFDRQQPRVDMNVAPGGNWYPGRFPERRQRGRWEGANPLEAAGDIYNNIRHPSRLF